jgi:hypothetical protein
MGDTPCTTNNRIHETGVTMDDDGIRKHSGRVLTDYVRAERDRSDR